MALSFAGAQRDYVGQVAAALKARGVRCFYDEDEQVRLWGTHLAEELPRIYAQESESGTKWGRLRDRVVQGHSIANLSRHRKE